MSHKGKTSAQRCDDARRRFYVVWMLIGIAFLVYLFGRVLDILAVPVAVVVWTVVFVLCLRTPVAKLESLGVPRVVGTALSYLGMGAIAAVLLATMFSPASGISEQFSNMLAGLPGYAQALIEWGNHLYGQYASVLQDESVRNWLNSAAENLTDWASTTARLSADGVLVFGTGVANSLMIIGFALVVAFWVLMELPSIGREAKRFIPENRQQEAEMLHLTFTRVMGGYLKATLLQCFLIGLACGIGFHFIGIPNAAALGLITGVMNIIPVVGPWIGGVIAALVGLFVDPWAAFFALVLTIVVQQFVYTFISPKIMSNSVDVHPAIVIVVLLVGSAIGGSMAGLVGSVAFYSARGYFENRVRVLFRKRDRTAGCFGRRGLFQRHAVRFARRRRGSRCCGGRCGSGSQAQVVCRRFPGRWKALACGDRPFFAIAPGIA